MNTTRKLSELANKSSDVKMLFRYYIDLTKFEFNSSSDGNGINFSVKSYPPKVYIDNDCICLKSIDGKTVRFGEEETREIKKHWLIEDDS